jgi:tRNA-dihydrouridine synthase
VPEGAAFAEMVAGHYEAMLAFYGVALGVKVARKHLGWYMDVAATPAPLRSEVLTADEPPAVLRRLPSALGGSAGAQAA